MEDLQASIAAQVKHKHTRSVANHRLQRFHAVHLYKSCHICLLSSAGVLAVVGYPKTSILSFTASGRPHNGLMLAPVAALASTAAASAKTCKQASYNVCLLHVQLQLYCVEPLTNCVLQ